MTKKILIIGALGMLGQDLKVVFPDALGWDKQEVDITNKTEVFNKIKKLKPTLVINAAAYNNVDACEKSTENHRIAEKLNGHAVGYLAQICAEIGAKFIHYSTNYVFDGKKPEGYDENDKPNPLNNYGLTKLLGERKITEVNGLAYYIIRTAKLFGKKGGSDAAKKNFFDIMLELSAVKKELRVVDDELSNFTYTPDLAGATKNLVEKKYANGTYHLVNENPCTWYEGARTLFDIIKKDVKVIPVLADEFKRPAKRPHYGILLNTKLPKLRGYQEALKKFLISN
ncbi:MAG: dTDP-4-dehydrorhamnose reductase [bacterium]|nr:dTDP-4-dehydrorhamnose reductase [bacterium]